MSTDDATRERSPSLPPSAPSRQTYALVVAEGPDKGQRFFFDDTLPPRVLLGTSPLCELRLQDREVSRRHLAFSVDAAGVMSVEDLGSTNGTTVAGVRVLRAFVRGGQEIVVGQTRLRVVQVPVTATENAPSPEVDRFGRVLGVSTMMRRLYPVLERAASSNEPVLLEGETGTGKELVAESLHEAGPRRAGPFVVVDCTTLRGEDASLVLFGKDGQRGAFAEADGGTLLLDEVADLVPEAQALILGALARGEVRAAGEARARKVDVRVISTSRRDVDRDVQDGRFRADLLFRVAVLRIELLPLRARRDDVVFLAEHFYRAQGGEGPLPEDLVQGLSMPSDWPGNVRELENLVARRLALGGVRTSLRGTEKTGPIVDPIEAVLAQDLSFPEARERVQAEFERRYVERILAAHGGNVARAGAASGIARRYFQIIKARQKG